MNQDKARFDPMPTAAQLADRIGCSVDQMIQVMNIESETEFRDYVDQRSD